MADEPKTNQPTDPPMELMAGTVAWYESGPEPILKDTETATLIVRIGMASNALAAQLQAGHDASQHRSRAAEQQRDLLCSFATACALTHEAFKLARKEKLTLLPLARRAGADTNLLERIENLIDGKHPACRLLKRARNRLVFHWDGDAITPSVRAFGRNQRVVWLEADADFAPVHRLAFEVLAHALFPRAGNLLEPVEQKRIIDEGMSHVDDVMKLIVDFFTACTYGYYLSRGIARRTINEPRA